MKYLMNTLEDFDVEGKTVLCRVDINSPLDPDTREPRDITRIERCVQTVDELLKRGAKVVLLAHQGGDLEYKNFGSLRPHAGILSQLLGRPVSFIDDVCGPAAREAISRLCDGEILVLENVRYMSEEMTMFETKLNLSPAEQAKTIVVRNLAPLADLYVCDAFAAVHRSQPTLVGFEEVLPSAMGRLFEEEVSALSRVRVSPERPSVFVLGGAKVQDAFIVMSSVLQDEVCDEVLTCGLVANIMLAASGIDIGKQSLAFLAQNKLESYIDLSKDILARFPDRVVLPTDVAYVDGKRCEVAVGDLPCDGLIVDIGHETCNTYRAKLMKARTIFMNGPAGVFEKPESEYGTKVIFEAAAEAEAFSVAGGGDSIAALTKYDLMDKFSYVSTAGGGLIRFMSGDELPVIKALKESRRKFGDGK